MAVAAAAGAAAAAVSVSSFRTAKATTVASACARASMQPSVARCNSCVVSAIGHAVSLVRHCAASDSKAAAAAAVAAARCGNSPKHEHGKESIGSSWSWSSSSWSWSWSWSWSCLYYRRSQSRPLPWLATAPLSTMLLNRDWRSNLMSQTQAQTQQRAWLGGGRKGGAGAEMKASNRNRRRNDARGGGGRRNRNQRQQHPSPSRGNPKREKKKKVTKTAHATNVKKKWDANTSDYYALDDEYGRDPDPDPDPDRYDRGRRGDRGGRAHPSRSHPTPPSKQQRSPRTPKFMLHDQAEAGSARLPPLFVSATVSPYVYVASCALETREGGRDYLELGEDDGRVHDEGEGEQEIEEHIDDQIQYDDADDDDGGDDDNDGAAAATITSLETSTPSRTVPSPVITPTTTPLLPQRIHLPPSFRNVTFEYVSPKSFGMELPNFNIPEVAFLGRSNVGKSSLVNAVTGRKELAKISKRPGRTQQVNYFAILPRDKLKRVRITAKGGGSNVNTNIAGGGTNNLQKLMGSNNDPSLRFLPSDATAYIVDLPGYGYASAPDQNIDLWQKQTQEFLLARRDAMALSRVYILIDSRRGPTDVDRAVMGWFDDAEVPYGTVLTKSDRVDRPSIVRRANEIAMRYHWLAHAGGWMDDGDGDGDGDGDADMGVEVEVGGPAGVVMGCMSPIVHVTSAARKVGINELLWSIEDDIVRGREEMRSERDANGAWRWGPR